MFRRAKFLEVLLEIRQEMARDADYDADLFAEMVRSGRVDEHSHTHSLPENEIKKSPHPQRRGK
jgi:hypothetical protein